MTAQFDCRYAPRKADMALPLTDMPVLALKCANKLYHPIICPAHICEVIGVFFLRILSLGFKLYMEMTLAQSLPWKNKTL